MKTINLIIASALGYVFVTSDVLASTIEYHFSWLTSGTVTATQTFTDTPFEVVITGNTQDVIQYPGQPSVYINLGTNGLDGPGLSGTVSGFGGAPEAITQPFYVLNRGGDLNNGAGFDVYTGREQVAPSSLIAQMNLGLGSALQSYDLTNSIGPITDSDPLFNPAFLAALALQTYPADVTSLSLTSARDLTFEARISETSSIPEPGTASLIVIALATLAMSRRQKPMRNNI